MPSARVIPPPLERRLLLLRRGRSAGKVRSPATGGLRRGAGLRVPAVGRNSSGDGKNPSAAAVTPRAAPAGKPAAAQRGASPAGRGSREARQEPARRPVPSRPFARLQRLPPQRGEPAVPGASSLLPRAGIAAGPAPLHPAARSFVKPTTPLGWVVVWVGFGGALSLIHI